MPDHLDSVKEYVRRMEGWRNDAAVKDEQTQVQTFTNRITSFNLVIEELERLRRVTKPIPASYGDLSDLPAELVKELTGIKVDDLEQQLFTIIKTGGDEVDLDAILIELYRRFQVVQTRKFLQNKLWRMAQKEIIYSVPARKGVYTATEPKALKQAAPSASSDDFDDLVGTPPGSRAARSRDSWGQPIKAEGGFGDDLDDDIPF